MDSKEIETLRKTLLTKRQEIAGEVDALKREGFSLGTDGTQDLGDDAANTYARQVLLGLSERERGILRQIDEALDRIDEGTFGICEDCGETIAAARLKAIPYATLCVECKATQETEPR